jgi:hypothetical protein
VLGGDLVLLPAGSFQLFPPPNKTSEASKTNDANEADELMTSEAAAAAVEAASKAKSGGLFGALAGKVTGMLGLVGKIAGKMPGLPDLSKMQLSWFDAPPPFVPLTPLQHRDLYRAGCQRLRVRRVGIQRGMFCIALQICCSLLL